MKYFLSSPENRWVAEDFVFGLSSPSCFFLPLAPAVHCCIDLLTRHERHQGKQVMPFRWCQCLTGVGEVLHVALVASGFNW